MTRVRRPRNGNAEINRLLPEDRPAHEWYRFVLSFPPHLVRDYLARLQVAPGERVLDPFCGTGTTVVEARKQGFAAVGLEANPMARFASAVKLDWSPDPTGLVEHAAGVAEAALGRLADDGIADDAGSLFGGHTGGGRRGPRAVLRGLSVEQTELLLADSISPLPLHKTLVLLECLDARRDERYHRHELLALARLLVTSIGNLHFGPEVGIGPPKPDAPVVGPWLNAVENMAADLRTLQALPAARAEVHFADARDAGSVLEPASVDAVITSPPYPNEKDYTRTTRLESVLLGFIRNKQELRELKRRLVRSNTRGVYRDDTDDRWVSEHPEIARIADAIEQRRIELGKTSGFERTYHRVARLYFGGMARHLADLRPALRPGARLAYVVGDQASYLRVMIRTGQLLGDIARSLGYELTGIDLFRTRLATATKEQLREEVVLLRWPGGESRASADQEPVR